MECAIKTEKLEKEEKIEFNPNQFLLLSRDDTKEWLFGMIMPEIHKQFRRDTPMGKPASYSLHLPATVYFFLFEFSRCVYEGEELLLVLPKEWQTRCFDVGACTGGSAEITKMEIEYKEKGTAGLKLSKIFVSCEYLIRTHEGRVKWKNEKEERNNKRLKREKKHTTASTFSS